MGKIKVLKEEELVGSKSSTPVYPVTAASAVYTSNNETVEQVLSDMESKINIGSGGTYYGEVSRPFKSVEYDASTKILTVSCYNVMGIYGHASTNEGLNSYTYDLNTDIIGPQGTPIRSLERCCLVMYFNSVQGYFQRKDPELRPWLNSESPQWPDPEYIPIPLLVIEPMYGIVYRADYNWTMANIKSKLPIEISYLKYAIENIADINNLAVSYVSGKYINFNNEFVEDNRNITSFVYNIKNLKAKILIQSHTSHSNHPLYAFVNNLEDGTKQVVKVCQTPINLYKWAIVELNDFNTADELWVMHHSGEYDDCYNKLDGHIFHNEDFIYTRVCIITPKTLFKKADTSVIEENAIPGYKYVIADKFATYKKIYYLPSVENSKVGDTIEFYTPNLSTGFQIRTPLDHSYNFGNNTKIICIFTDENKWSIEQYHFTPVNTNE